MMQTNIKIIPATLTNYPVIQNMARYYVYDRTPFMGWSCQESGQFDCIDFKHYFETAGEEAFLLRVNNELAGFVLLDKTNLIAPVDWNMGEFFILAKFQNSGIGSYVVKEILKSHHGKWTVAVMPENTKAVNFWRKLIKEVTKGNYTEVFKSEVELETAENPDPYAMNILSFEIGDL